MSIRRILEALSGRDYRVTWQRWAVAAHIALKRDQLFTVEELYNSLKQHYPDIGLTTVYRTLDLLTELGIVDRIPDADGVARYMLRIEDVEASKQFICERCGQTYDVEIENIQPLLTAVARREGFQIDYYEIRLYGVCARCLRQDDAQAQENDERRSRTR